MIDYSKINHSIEYYGQHGFKRIEAPWAVTKQIMSITKPPKVDVDYEFVHNGKCMVASGEQSYLYLYVKDFLPKGKFQTVTPCLRYENFDVLHTKCFMKNELIDTQDTTKESLERMIDKALDFFQQYLPESEIVETAIGYDIECHGYELGSYGIRQCSFLKWVYGTGVAEPRLSRIVEAVEDF